MQEYILAPKIIKYRDNKAEPFEGDPIAVESPLSIVIIRGEETHPFAMTMRSPGKDRFLAAGLLFNEGVIDHPQKILDFKECSGSHKIKVFIDGRVKIDHRQVERQTVMNSSCGICGKKWADSLNRRYSREKNFEVLPDLQIIHQLSIKMRQAQVAFDKTGSVHGCGLFSYEGDLLNIAEDVGRHNALDKLIGMALLDGEIPLKNRILFLSGRVSFELVQKSKAAGIGTIVAVGAPSSYAIELAQSWKINLIGFARSGGFNLYAGEESQ